MNTSFRWSLVTVVAIVTAGVVQPAGPPRRPRRSGDAAFDEVARALSRGRLSPAADVCDVSRHPQVQRQAPGPVPPSGAWTRSPPRASSATVPRPSTPRRCRRPTQLDREQLLHAIDSRLLTLEVVRPWARDPDTYSSGLTNTAYIMIKRAFAPPEERLRQLIAREKAMPAALAEARKNLENPPRIYTEIAIEQIDGNRGFFQTAVAVGLPHRDRQGAPRRVQAGQRRGRRRAGRLQEMAAGRPVEALDRRFAIGEDTFRKKLAADEMIELPLDELLAIAEKDLRKNQAAFADTARLIDPKRTPMQVLETVQSDYPPASKLLATTQGELDALGRFMSDRASDHGAEGRPGGRAGDAALPPRHDERVDGHSRPVRKRRDRGVLQHDAARSRRPRPGTRASS